MERESLTEFSGVAGRVLLRSIGASSAITGMVLGVVMLVGGFVLGVARAPQFVMPFSQIVTALALARFTVNGLHGEWSGTLFSTAGGSWARVASVGGRYLALTAVWLLPMMLTGALQPQATMTMGPALTGNFVIVLLLYVLAASLTPPVFLVVSVTAESFADVFRPDHWKQQFGRRLGDLFAVYVVYTGTLGMVLVLCLAPVGLAFMLSVKLGLFAAAVAMSLLLGMSVNLLGRLCGFYACGDLGLAEPFRDPPVAPQPDPVPSPDTSPASPCESSPSTEVRDPAPAPSSLPVSGTPAPVVPALQVSAESVPPQQVPAPPVADQERRAPLLDAHQRVDGILKRFAVDPESAISGLQDLNRSFAPHPLVLQSLALCLHRAGQPQPALVAARQALPLCFERGHLLLAAEIFRTMPGQQDELGLDREQLLQVATALDKRGDLATAARAFSAVIRTDAGETRAIKGLLQVADRILQEKSKPDSAAKVYRYLLQNCSASPLVEYMQLGLQKAERQLA